MPEINPVTALYALIKSRRESALRNRLLSDPDTIDAALVLLKNEGDFSSMEWVRGIKECSNTIKQLN